MKLVVGLGNPGPRYVSTRHNVGVRIVERFAERHGIALDEERFLGRFGAGWVSTRRAGPGAGDDADRDGAATRVALLVPETWMNRSGAAVALAIAELPDVEPPRDLLVAFDDVDLPFGRLRLRPAGSAGGHRGLADVLEALDRRDVPRLRFGVGRAAGGETTDHVLARFSRAEEEALPPLLERAADAVLAALLGDFGRAMNEFNRDPSPSDGGAPRDRADGPRRSDGNPVQ